MFSVYILNTISSICFMKYVLNGTYKESSWLIIYSSSIHVPSNALLSDITMDISFAHLPFVSENTTILAFRHSFDTSKSCVCTIRPMISSAFSLIFSGKSSESVIGKYKPHPQNNSVFRLLQIYSYLTYHILSIISTGRDIFHQCRNILQSTAPILPFITPMSYLSPTIASNVSRKHCLNSAKCSSVGAIGTSIM